MLQILKRIGRAAILYQEPWFAFEDINGVGLARPDFVRYEPETKRLAIIECKNTQSPDAVDQLERLYMPVVWPYAERKWAAKSIILIACYRNSYELFPTSLKAALDGKHKQTIQLTVK